MKNNIKFKDLRIKYLLILICINIIVYYLGI